MVKIGIRKPSIKASIKAHTVGKAKRRVKKAVVPGYGKKGMGWVSNPKKSGIQRRAQSDKHRRQRPDQKADEVSGAT